MVTIQFRHNEVAGIYDNKTNYSRVKQKKERKKEKEWQLI
jgi:hypothetical protein